MMNVANRLRMDSLLQTIESSFIPNDFIMEVEARPAIWNPTDPLYSNQTSKRASWDSLIKKYHPEFDNRPGAEQTLIASHYRRKWKSFRDSFARELAKIKNSSKTRKTKYMYFNQLSFLLSVKGVPSSNIDDVESYLNDTHTEQVESEENTNNQNNHNSNDGPDFSIFETQPSEMFKGNLPLNLHAIKRESPFVEYQLNDKSMENGSSICHKRIKLEDDSWNPLSTIISNNSHNHHSTINHNPVTDCDDEDKLFLLSLLSELKRVPLSIKLDVKCDLLNVFKNARLHYMPLANNIASDPNLENETNDEDNILEDSPIHFTDSNHCNSKNNKDKIVLQINKICNGDDNNNDENSNNSCNNEFENNINNCENNKSDD